MVTRASHPGRAASSGPFANPALTAATTAAERTLTETCRIGTVTTTTDPNPPYNQTSTFVPDTENVPCSVEPIDGREVDLAGDPSALATFHLRVARGTDLPRDRFVEITAGRNTGLRLAVFEVHESSTEPLLRATCRRYDPGEP